MNKRERGGRVGDIIQREISRLIRDELRDPRIGMVTILSVDLSRDLNHAKVYVSILEDDKVKESIEVLNKAAGFLRSELAKRVSLRVVPSLKFIFDPSVVTGNKMEQILDKIFKDEKKS